MAFSVGSLPASSRRDRTSEFHAISDSLRKAQPSYGSAANGSVTTSNGHNQESSKLLGREPSESTHSEFNRRASRIGLSIHQTSQKLSKLTKLAKRTSMFDDPAVEIQDLTSVIKQDITALNAAISDLQVLCDSRNDAANQTKHSTEHSTTIVDDLKSRLMSTTKDFKDVLTMRTENLKVHQNRQQLFSATASKDQSNPFARQQPLATASSTSTSTALSASPAPWANGATSNSQLFSSRRRSTLHYSEPRAAQGQEQMQQQMVPVQDSYMQNRAEALQNVESTIVELSNIFSQLATMVAQQGEMAIRSDNIKFKACHLFFSGIQPVHWMRDSFGFWNWVGIHYLRLGSTDFETLAAGVKFQKKCVLRVVQTCGCKSTVFALCGVTASQEYLVLETCQNSEDPGFCWPVWMVCRIDENMDDTLANVEGAQGQLLKYLNSISSNRWLIIKIFFVLVTFLLVFVLFVA